MGRTKRKARKRQSYYDYSMLILVIFIVAFGLVMVYSASSFTAQTHDKYGYDAAFFLKKQAKSALAGATFMLLVSKLDYRFLLKRIPLTKLKWAPFAFLIATFLQGLVLVIGDEVNGAKRWLSIGGFSFQPSEVTKVAVIIFASYIIFAQPEIMKSILGSVKVGIFCALPIILIVIENLSTAIVIVCILGVMCFIASTNGPRTILVISLFILLAVGVIIILYFGEGFRMTRIQIWLDVENHEGGQQILQGLYAIASGGLFGTGLGQSMQKLGFIPESYNDMIFSIICEELGLCGAIIVMIVFIMIMWRIYTIASHSPDLFGALICYGVMAHIAIQVFLNIAVVTNFLPSTGVPLPFVSYGGTSLMILMAEMGLVLSVSNKIEN